MIREEGETPRAKPNVAHLVGESLDTLSVEDLQGRIVLLQQEILRLEGAIATKQASKSAADAFFKR